MKNHPALRVVIIYEDLQAGLRARQLSARLDAHFEAQMRVHCYLWKFETLRHPLLRAQAAEDAAKADVILISTTAKKALPDEVMDWAHRWIAQRKERSPGLVALLNPQLEEPPPAFCDYLRAITEAAGMDFLYEHVSEPLLAHAGPSAFGREWIPKEIDGMPQGRSHPAQWGINE